MKFLLVLDQGTTSTRAIVFDETLAVAGMGQRALQQYFPAPGLVEHDPQEIWQATLAVAQEALKNAGLSAGDIATVGLTNQRETTLLWERATGRPLHHAIVWQDRRTAAQCAELKSTGAEALIRERTGLLIDPYFSASKLRWLLDHIPGARVRAARGELAFGTMDSWLAWQLTGGREHVTDATNAARTQLYNIHLGAWDNELLALWDIPHEVLPRVVDSSGIALEIDPACGLRGTLGGIAGDQQAALFGQQCFEPGSAKCTYGTGCFILVNAGASCPIPSAGVLATLAWQINGQPTYALEGSVFMGGATVQWLRDGLGIIEHAYEIEALAASVPNTEGLILVPAFTGLGAPHWDPSARGLLIGLTRGTGRAHIARAALEAIALQVSDVLTTLQSDLGRPLQTLRVDGGAARNALLMQLQADLAGLVLQRAAQPETTALGAALLAGLGAGVWQNLDAVRQLWQQDQQFYPAGDAAAIAQLQTRWRAGVARSRGWAEIGI